jgi:gamma-glutamyl hydrolase
VLWVDSTTVCTVRVEILKYFCYSITFQELIASDIADEWHILSVNSYKGSEFISSVEHRKYPFYGVQFHPEKNAFEWKVESIPHSAAAILVGQFYGNFFISEGMFHERQVGSV